MTFVVLVLVAGRDVQRNDDLRVLRDDRLQVQARQQQPLLLPAQGG